MDKTFRHKREQKTESQNLKKETKKNKNRIAEPITPKHIMVFPLKIILMLCERSLNPRGEVLWVGMCRWDPGTFSLYQS